jgi:hypothetical protein
VPVAVPVEPEAAVVHAAANHDSIYLAVRSWRADSPGGETIADTYPRTPRLGRLTRPCWRCCPLADRHGHSVVASRLVEESAVLIGLRGCG